MRGWGCRRSVDACLSTSSSGRFRRELQIAAGVDGAQRCASQSSSGTQTTASPGCTHTSAPTGAKTYCVYDAPTPEAIRKTATRNALPVDRITQVRVLDPYFHL